jgi:hypothetical protein
VEKHKGIFEPAIAVFWLWITSLIAPVDFNKGKYRWLLLQACMQAELTEENNSQNLKVPARI